MQLPPGECGRDPEQAIMCADVQSAFPDKAGGNSIEENLPRNQRTFRS